MSNSSSNSLCWRRWSCKRRWPRNHNLPQKHAVSTTGNAVARNPPRTDVATVLVVDELKAFAVVGAEHLTTASSNLFFVLLCFVFFVFCFFCFLFWKLNLSPRQPNDRQASSVDWDQRCHSDSHHCNGARAILRLSLLNRIAY